MGSIASSIAGKMELKEEFVPVMEAGKKENRGRKGHRM